MNFSDDAWASLPAPWPARLKAELAADEKLIAWFQPDLDLQLHFVAGFVALTDRRLLSYETASSAIDGGGTAAHQRNGFSAHHGQSNGQAAASGTDVHDDHWRSWNFHSDLELTVSEHAGVGTLQLCDDQQRFAHWRFTAAQSASARRLEARFAALKAWRADSETAVANTPTVCPSCGEVITSDDGVCIACSNVAPPPPVSSLYRLLSFAKPQRWMILLTLALTIAGGAAALIPPYLTMPLLNNVFVPRYEGKEVPPQLVYYYLAGLFAASVAAFLLGWARLFVSSRVSEQITSDLRLRTYSHLQQLSVEFFGGKRTGDLMSRISNDTERICNFLSLNLVDFVNDTLMIVMTSVILLSINPGLAVVALVPIPLIIWLVYGVRRPLRHSYSQSSVAWGHLTSVLADTIPGIRVVKAFAQEQREIDRFEQANRHLFNVNNRLNVVWSIFGPLVTMLTEIGLLIVWAFAVWQVFRDNTNINVGVLTLFVAYIARFYGRMESMIRIATTSQRAAASAQRIFEILDRVPSVPEPAKPIHAGRLKGSVELRGVRFKYGSREVLHGLDLQIEPGEMIGLVGPSGAGKSTLINLICRFFDVADGSILVDGADIRSFPVAEYRKNIGIVLQDPFLFYGTVAENIAYGKPNATQAEIVAAARAARAHDFILQLADGYDSLVGERGQSLSGGERQRISIARAILIDPRILILDEATSSVDTETEREIQIALDNLIRGRTTIAIAHRLSTLRKADRLVVVERGLIAEIGKHTELLDRQGAYARLHKAQTELIQGIGV
ncbi:MAG TPA: ABC transporter ATP-binding protein [Pirellulales bacterium]